MHNQREHFMAWAPYGSNMKDTEIGINSNVAKAIGKECLKIDFTQKLYSILVLHIGNHARFC